MLQWVTNMSFESRLEREFICVSIVLFKNCYVFIYKKDSWTFCEETMIKICINCLLFYLFFFFKKYVVMYKLVLVNFPWDISYLWTLQVMLWILPYGMPKSSAISGCTITVVLFHTSLSIFCLLIWKRISRVRIINWSGH